MITDEQKILRYLQKELGKNSYIYGIMKCSPYLEFYSKKNYNIYIENDNIVVGFWILDSSYKWTTFKFPLSDPDCFDKVIRYIKENDLRIKSFSLPGFRKKGFGDL